MTSPLSRIALPRLALFCLALPVAAYAQAKPAACPVQPARTFTEADHILATGDAPRAESLFRQQLAATPSVANYAGIVHSLLDENKLPEAIAQAQAAATALPTSGDAQALVGEALARAGQVPEAAAAYAKAITLDRCSVPAHLGMGKLDNLVGRHLSAAREILATHAVAPSDLDVTVAFLDYVKPELRAATLRNFLAAKPELPPATLSRLQTQLAIAEQNATCTPTQPITTATLGLEPLLFQAKYTRSWGLTVRIDEAKLPLLELDSSTSGIVLNPDDAKRANVHPLSSTPVPPGQPYMALADRIQIGNLEFHNCPVRVVPADQLAGVNSLIGTDFFRDHLIRIDYVAENITLSPLPALPPTAQAGFADQFIAPSEQDWSPVYIAGPDVLVPTLINKQGPYLFVLDTGSPRTVLSPAVTTSLLGASQDRSLNLYGSSTTIIKYLAHEGGGDIHVTDIHGLNGVVLPVYTPVKEPVYRFAKSEVPDVHSIAFDLNPTSRELGTEVSGLLGFNIVQGFLIELNYRDALAHILFDQNRRYQVREAGRH